MNSARVKVGGKTKLMSILIKSNRIVGRRSENDFNQSENELISRIFQLEAIRKYDMRAFDE